MAYKERGVQRWCGHWLGMESGKPLLPLEEEMKHHEGIYTFRHKSNVTSVKINDLMCREGLFLFRRLRMT